MKIGIFTARQFPQISANTAIAYDLGMFLHTKLKHDVVFAGYKYLPEQEPVTEYQGIPIHFVNQKERTPDCHLKNMIKSRTDEAFFMFQEARSLGDMVRREHLEAFIVIIAPSENLCLVNKANLDIPIFLIQLDPYFHFSDGHESPHLKRQFLKSLGNVAKAYITRPLFEIYRKDPRFAPLVSRMELFQFPKLKRSGHSSDAEERTTASVLYAGTLYHTIRSPKLLLALQCSLPPDYTLIFMGCCDSPADTEELQNSPVDCRGQCSVQEVKTANQQAGALLCIGNQTRMQESSKLIDLISTGKPIINIYQYDECPTRDILKQYTLSLSLSAGDLLEGKAKGALSEFLLTTRGKKIVFRELQDKYREYSLEYVATHIADDIQRHLEDNE